MGRNSSNSSGIVDEGAAGIEWNRQAIEMAQASDEERAHRWQGALLNNTGWTLFDMGETEQALDYFERALVYRQEQGDQPSIWIARWCVARAWRGVRRLTSFADGQGSSLMLTHSLLADRTSRWHDHFA